MNDSNLQELQRTLGVRISFRGDSVTLSGTAEQVERAAPVVQGLIDLARIGEPVTPDDVYRLAADAPSGELAARRPTARSSCPGLRRAIAPKTQGQRDYLQAIANHDIVVGIGPAGTGKTYLAVAKAVEALARKRVKRIILARPAVEAGESLGFLPGDLQAKVDPYLRPLYDALEDMMPHDRVQRALETRTIEIAPLAYMRGRTLADAFIILDEAQNATGAQMKMFLTRLGVNSKTVVTGDKTQIDLPRGRTRDWCRSSGCSPASRASPSATCTRPTWYAIGWCGRSSGPMRRTRTADVAEWPGPARVCGNAVGALPATGSGSTWSAGLPLRGASRSSPISSSRRRSVIGHRRCPPVGQIADAHRGRAVRVRDSQVPRGDRPRGRVARAHRPAGLSLQPHRLRLRARRRARRSSPSWSAPSSRGSRSPAGGGRRRGRSLGPAETAYLTVDSQQRRRLQEVATHFLAEALSRGVADAGVLRGEASPAAEPPAGRNRARRPARLHPHLRRSDGAGRGRRRPTSTIAVGQRTLRRLVGAFYHPTIVPDLALTSARREQLRAQRGSGEVLRARGRAHHHGRASRSPRTRGPSSQPLREELAGGAAVHSLLRGAAGALLYNAHRAERRSGC